MLTHSVYCVKNKVFGIQSITFLDIVQNPFFLRSNVSNLIIKSKKKWNTITVNGIRKGFAWRPV